MNEIDLNLLKILHPGEFISGEVISKKLGVSRTTIWKHINKLKNAGYQIKAVTNKGYQLIKIPEKIIAEEIFLGLNTDLIGREIKIYPTLGSTNEEAKKQARLNCPEGTVIIAEEQTAGKGRLGRNWFSPAGTGLWFSLIVRPDLPPNRAPFLTVLTSLVLTKVLNGLAVKLKPVIKWPNDLLIGEKKVSGILSELNADLDLIKYAIIGVGININQDDFPGDLKNTATSLKKELGFIVDRNQLLIDFMNQFEVDYQRLNDRKFTEILAEWKKHLNIIGKMVTIFNGNKSFQGKVKDISPLGELIIKNKDGEEQKFWAGDVSLRQN